LLNARLSEKSFRRWQHAKGWISAILATFDLCLAQTDEARHRLEKLGAKRVLSLGNLKYAAAPAPFDEKSLAKLKSEIGDRPLWLMASTHEGEEEIAAQVHKDCARDFPNLLTIVLPRHPSRGDAIAALLNDHGLRTSQRSKAAPILPDTSVLLADTLGETGLFFRLSPIVCMGGTFAWQGHNPIEPAQVGGALLFGPRMANFAEIAAEMLESGAALQVATPADLTREIKRFLSDKGLTERLSRQAFTFVSEKSHILESILEKIAPYLSAKGNQ
jgi:3-deoxy-D-manno-octulosonic-acid transferase